MIVATGETGTYARPATSTAIAIPLARSVAAVVPAPAGGLGLTGDLEAAGRVIALDLGATVAGGDDRVELAAGATVDARKLGMTWSPAGNLRTPVAPAVLACLRRAA